MPLLRGAPRDRPTAPSRKTRTSPTGAAPHAMRAGRSRRAGVALAALTVIALAGTAATAVSTGSAKPSVQAEASNLMSLSGETWPVHDPALIIEGNTWYVFSTGRSNRENGGAIQINTSTDNGATWAYTGTIWKAIPAWIDSRISGVGSLWAPDIYKHGGTYYLYYSASTFGSNTSITALATNTTLNPKDPAYRWVDQGEVVASPVSVLPDGKTFNAIDANIIEANGKSYMAIGSSWYGIWLVEIGWPSGKPVSNWKSTAVNLADRFQTGNAIEAPFIYYHSGYYYLFVSFDACCLGGNSTYKVAVGRSTSVTGPYLDKNGKDMYGGGGSVILSTNGTRVGPGGQSVYNDYLAFHYYDGANTTSQYMPTLGVSKISWVNGWPVVG